ncbi:MAG: hypothetical protein ABWZ57_15855 [Mesorhizobium sp.]
MVAFDEWSARIEAKQAGPRWRQGDRAVYRRIEGRLSWVRVMEAADEDGRVLVCLEMMRRGRGRSVYPFLAPTERLFGTLDEALEAAPAPATWPAPFLTGAAQV